VQYRPTALELLEGVAKTLDEDVLPVIDEALRHRIRVCVNLLRIVAREYELDPVARELEREGIVALTENDAPLDELRDALFVRLRKSNDETFDRDAWRVLVDVIRRDLAISKPGYDAWEGG